MDHQIGDVRGVALSSELVEKLLTDSKTLAFLKAYLAIPDETVKAHLRRLVRELARLPADATSSERG